jgi:hypothetical protein
MTRIVTVTTKELTIEECVSFLKVLAWGEASIIRAMVLTNSFKEYTLGGVKVIGRARGNKIARFVQIQVQEEIDDV